MEKIPFICVNYNTKDETVKYIQNVLTLDDNEYAHVIVVDNSPTDEDFRFLEKYIQNFQENHHVQIIRTENKGYFHALNVGIEFAAKVFGSLGYAVIGNNDIIFKKDFITNINSVELDNEWLVLAPDVITNEGSHENPHVINKMGFMRKMKYRVYFSNYYIAQILNKFKSVERPYKEFDPEQKTIYMGIGALYVLTPNFFKNFSKLWDKVFLYGEEAIFAGQINSVEGKILYSPSLTCYHNESSTTSKIEKKSKYKIIQKSYKIYKKYL